MTTEKTVEEQTENFVTTTSDAPVIETPVDNSVADADKPEVEDKKAESSDTPDDKTPENKGEEDDKSKTPGADTTAEQETAAPKKGKNRVQKRIDDVVRERENEKRAHEKTKRELEELKGSSNKDQEKKQDSNKEPVESDFDTYDEYLTALDKHSSSEPEAKAPEKKPEPKVDNKDQDTDELTDNQKTAMAVISDKVDEGAKKYSDFEEVALNKEVPISGTMLEALAECEDPAKVMYHLGKNIESATEIAGLSPAQQMREITKLDMSVTIKPEKPVKTTTASDPISPVGGSDAQEKAIGDMSFSEYETKMNKQERDKEANPW